MIFWSLFFNTPPQEAYHPVVVPLIYGEPELGWGTISYRFQRPYDPSKPLVMVVEDALTTFLNDQSFTDFLNERFNILTIKGRYSQYKFGAKLWWDHKEVNWSMAYKVFNSSQLIRDLETVRKVVMNNKPITVLGISSGAALAQHYVSRYPGKVKKVLLIDPFLMDLQNAMGLHIHNILPGNTGSLEKVFWDIYSGEKTSFSRNGFVEEDNNNLGLQVRVFEHVYPYLEGEEKLPSPLLWLEQKIAPLVQFYMKNPFTVDGIHYDRLQDFEGKAIILSGEKDLLVNHQVDQVLAAYYPDATFFLFNDSHRLPIFQKHVHFKDFVKALLGDDVLAKQAVYKKLWDEGWIYPLGNSEGF